MFVCNECPEVSYSMNFNDFICLSVCIFVFFLIVYYFAWDLGSGKEEEMRQRNRETKKCLEASSSGSLKKGKWSNEREKETRRKRDWGSGEREMRQRDRVMRRIRFLDGVGKGEIIKWKKERNEEKERLRKWRTRNKTKRQGEFLKEAGARESSKW